MSLSILLNRFPNESPAIAQYLLELPQQTALEVLRGALKEVEIAPDFSDEDLSKLISVFSRFLLVDLDLPSDSLDFGVTLSDEESDRWDELVAILLTSQ